MGPNRMSVDQILVIAAGQMLLPEIRIGSHRPRTGSLRTTTLGTSDSPSSMNAASPFGPKASGISVVPVR